MNKDIHSGTPAYPVAGKVGEVGQTIDDATNKVSVAAQKVSGVAEVMAADAIHATKDAAQYATATAKELYQSAALKAEDALATSEDYVRRNPVPAVLGAFAFGVAVGCLVMMARHKPTFGQRYADEPVTAIREAILSALAPVAQRVHEGYDSARHGAGKAMDRMHDLRMGKCMGKSCNSLSDRLGRIGNNIKFR